MRATLLAAEQAMPPFNWQREYAPLWEGHNDGRLNDILFKPGPDDVLTIDGITATWAAHQDGSAKRHATAKRQAFENSRYYQSLAAQQNLSNAYQNTLLHPVNTCRRCHARPKVSFSYTDLCRQCEIEGKLGRAF